MEQAEFEATGIALICGDVFDPFIPLDWWCKWTLLQSGDNGS